jgi:hypothetical protein
MKKTEKLINDMDTLCKEMNEIIKQNKYLNLKLKYNYCTDEQMKKLYKRHMDVLAKSIVNKQAI